jgi:ubiquinone/menaquinone biosynthesis C-methylase UbiE
MLMSAFDRVAPSFDKYRRLPRGIPEAIRSAVFDATKIASSQPRLLDIGCGTGRIGWPFVVAGDDYVGVDLSAGMLGEFAHRAATPDGGSARLVLADGRQLPFADAVFDVVLLIHVFGWLGDWRRLGTEARRVLRLSGSLILGRIALPADGIDARMKRRLASILETLGAELNETNTRSEVECTLAAEATAASRVIAATWTCERTPRGFIERHRSGARFSSLSAPIKEDALHELASWAAATFGSLNATFTESHLFELQIFKFQNRMDRP